MTFFSYADINKIFTNIRKEIYLDLNKEDIIIPKPLLNFAKFYVAKLCKISKLSTKIMVTSAQFEGAGAKM